MKYRLFARKGKENNSCEVVLTNGNLSRRYMHVLISENGHKDYTITDIPALNYNITKSTPQTFDIEFSMPNLKTVEKTIQVKEDIPTINLTGGSSTKNNFREIIDIEHIVGSMFKFSDIEHIDVERFGTFLIQQRFLPSI